jgi:hypothetical protein
MMFFGRMDHELLARFYCGSLTRGCFTIVGDGTASAQQDKPDPKAKKGAFDPGAIRTLQATLPSGWKDDETFLDVRRFMKDGKEDAYVFAVLYNGQAPKTQGDCITISRKMRHLRLAASTLSR